MRRRQAPRCVTGLCLPLPERYTPFRRCCFCALRLAVAKADRTAPFLCLMTDIRVPSSVLVSQVEGAALSAELSGVELPAGTGAGAGAGEVEAGQSANGRSPTPTVE